MERTKGSFYHANFRCGRFEPCECAPVIHHQSRANNVRASVHGTSLTKRRKRERERDFNQTRNIPPMAPAGDYLVHLGLVRSFADGQDRPGS